MAGGARRVPLSDIMTTGGAFTKGEAKTAVPVAIAESSGNPRAVNPNIRTPEGTVEDMIGLMQISTMHLKEGGLLHGEFDREELFNPYINAQAAKIIYDAQGWGAWEGYTNGNWRRYIGKDPLVGLGPKDSPTPGVIDAADDVIGTVGDAAEAVTGGFDWVTNPGSWYDIGKVVLGGALIVMGTAALVFIIANKTGATPVARVAKAAKAAKAVT